MKVSKGRGSKDKNEAIVEDRKSAGKRKAVGKVSESRNSSSSSKRRTGSVNNVEKQASAKDPNKPKRPASAFFVFLEEFRKVYKEENPNVKAVSAVSKTLASYCLLIQLHEALFTRKKDVFICLFVQEKAPYEAKAAKRKSDYQKLMNAYNKKQVESVDENEEDEDEEEEPAKLSKKPKVNGAKEDDEADSEEEDEDDDDDDDEDDD
ncbi:unnamed protein product [Linum tenue]|uniref:HMG box domain-containing protein n=1 Tax=Linum tenue TaxID=586396 RepID=A0AAV0K1E7_9ROSI|nr:unnamed protein product [Linum tenue]